ncbi:hypothetical protein LSUE1_G004563 [Lachnellula suecica]|uniref:Uncharacterized protein n=1 Tax=Lachnellula suecica TaxID=602035 RepID=A0A8T9CDD9_9HELO|nr:hypothetical protein LSUE1_G004563 [Lachnellula suecica]
MGANLSDMKVVDTSVDIISPEERGTEVRIAILWASSFYVFAMIFYTCALADRWRGPHGRSPIGFAGVVGALVCSAAWPLVAVYLFTSAG